jgi:hypothetical protein
MQRCQTIMTLVLVFLAPVWASAEKAKTPARDESAAVASTPQTQNRALAREETGLDLVVSKVRLTRGSYPHGTVQIVSYVKNMCNGSTREIVKVGYPDYEMALFIHDGIGPQEEKSAGAIYRCTTSDCAIGPLEVVVDPDGAIDEHDDSNNTCANVHLRPGERSKTVACPITRYECGRSPEIGKYRARQTKTR